MVTIGITHKYIECLEYLQKEWPHQRGRNGVYQVRSTGWSSRGVFWSSGGQASALIEGCSFHSCWSWCASLYVTGTGWWNFNDFSCSPPKGSMYGIFTKPFSHFPLNLAIFHLVPSVGKYSSPMHPMGSNLTSIFFKRGWNLGDLWYNRAFCLQDVSWFLFWINVGHFEVAPEIEVYFVWQIYANLRETSQTEGKQTNPFKDWVDCGNFTMQLTHYRTNLLFVYPDRASHTVLGLNIDIEPRHVQRFFGLPS